MVDDGQTTDHGYTISSPMRLKAELKMARVPSKDSDQPGHPPSLIRVFAVCSMGS